MVLSRQQRLDLAALVVALLSAGCVGDGGRLSSAEVPDGVSGQMFDGQPVLAVREGETLRVFRADVHHLEGEPISFCPVQRVFASPFHGETFDLTGAVVGGPASRGLDEIPVIEHAGYVVQAGEIRLGPKRPPDGAPEPGNGKPWDSGPGSFCEGRIDLSD